MSRVGFSWLVVIALGCGAGDPPPPASSPPPLSTPQLPEEGVPDQLACSADEDCVSAGWVPEDHPCCNYNPFAPPHARTFVEWYDAWRADTCGAVDCDAVDRERFGDGPRPMPAPPARCATEPRCHAGRCTHNCDCARRVVPQEERVRFAEGSAEVDPETAEVLGALRARAEAMFGFRDILVRAATDGCETERDAVRLHQRRLEELARLGGSFPEQLLDDPPPPPPCGEGDDTWDGSFAFSIVVCD